MSKNSYEKLSKKFKIIYLAGLFDGEGSFGFWSKGKNRGRIFECKVEMADKDLILRFKDMFGGWLFFAKRRKLKHKDTWCWRDRGPRAFAIIDKMINFMSKRRQEKYYVVKRNKISSLSRK
tara:strand:+ start:177 stop:539 length:363 start_codon:yes stop_codon:yes gene_type:complete